jgi:Undecaprenyl-phosphate glucose phosphotransferase
MADLSEATVDVRLIPDVLGYMTLGHRADDLDGLPVISLHEGPHYGWNRILKRAMDIAFSLVALCLFAPVMALVAVLVKLSSRGPVFYRQERMGLDGRSFAMLKFRTMRPDAEGDGTPQLASREDGRCTGLGAWLRRTSLDELPQLFNVLAGQMSMVGPRPERPFFIRKIKKEVPNYMLRHKVKAGITGWAQVNGWRGGQLEGRNLKKRIQYDLFYVKNWSVCFDLKILFLTLFRGFSHPNAY